MNSTLTHTNSDHDEMGGIIGLFDGMNISASQPRVHFALCPPSDDKDEDVMEEDTDKVINSNTNTNPNQERTPFYSEADGRWYLSCGCNRNYVSKTSAIICHSGRKYKSRKSGPSPCDFGEVMPMDI